MAVLLAGVYMIIAGLRIEGAVEVFLGAPLLGSVLGFLAGAALLAWKALR